MQTATEGDLRDWSGRTLIDRNGEEIGEIDFLYVDRGTERPEWAGVLNLHLLGMRPALVPLARASVRGHRVRVPNVTKQQVRGAPYVEPDAGLSEADEALLAGYYRLSPRVSRRPMPPKPPAGPRRRPRPPGRSRGEPHP
ncbi:MAG: PRC-barrel domain-containing protein [Actinomycetota bacterium]|nr:PRC-barrel domain-containing protein [Actinomycetota bacterium]MDQ3648436.1 PRC-barrel domain-containing protein [Actinomycetota bacterium]